MEARSSIRLLDPESDYDDPEEGRKAEAVAKQLQANFNPRVFPLRKYLDEDTVTTLGLALQALDLARPEDPVEFFAYYLLKHSNK